MMIGIAPTHVVHQQEYSRYAAPSSVVWGRGGCLPVPRRLLRQPLSAAAVVCTPGPRRALYTVYDMRTHTTYSSIIYSSSIFLVLAPFRANTQ